MPSLPLSYPTTSLSTSHPDCSTEMSNSTGYTSHCPGNSGGGEGVDAGEQEEKMENFLLGSGWHDPRAPPAERLKHLYYLLEKHYDLTGGDYYDQCTYHTPTTDDQKGTTQPGGYSAAYMPYLTSIGVDLDFLKGSSEISSNPMADLIDETFCHHTSLEIPRHGNTPISRWEIDWSRPLPKVIFPYWEVMQHIRTKPAHVFMRAKPVVGNPRVTPQPYSHQNHFPRYHDIEGKVHRMSRLRAVLHKARELVISR